MGKEIPDVTTDRETEFGNMDEGRTFEEGLCVFWNGVEEFRNGDWGT